MNNISHSINRVVKTLVLFFSILICSLSIAQESVTPWKAYVHPEEAGFSMTALDSVTTIYNTSGASALLVVSKGHVVLSLGNTTRRYMVHSIRKSFMNAMIGKAIGEGLIDMDASLEALGIDDQSRLTTQEKKATVYDILSARSGIYLPSAYATRDMIENLPERGSKEPGTDWYYNNWDFNVLASIYNKKTGRDFFEAFNSDIASPIGMQDFRMTDTHYRLEPDQSEHPAYLFKMSARDMARFGQLYLNGGTWNGHQIISQDWVNKSVEPVSLELGTFADRDSYGLLWWVSKTECGQKMYYASGLGGHRIVIIPGEELIIVFRGNTYEGRGIREQTVNTMIEMIVNARQDDPKKDPKLTEYSPLKEDVKDQYGGAMDQYLGSYRHPFFGQMHVKKSQDNYELQTNVGRFRLFALAGDHFYAEDLSLTIRMVKATDADKSRTIEMIFNTDRTLKEAICYY